MKQLPIFFDTVKLEADLAVADTWPWMPNGISGWMCLQLRSRGGLMADGTEGLHKKAPWLDTALLEKTDYFREVIRTIELTLPCTVTSARVSLLPPGCIVHPHTDREQNRRIHVPIISDGSATITFGELAYSMRPGEAWAGDFAKSHGTKNLGTVRRVHLIFVLG